MTKIAEEPTRLPEMTERHIEAAMAPAAIIESGVFANERLDITAVVRALSTGGSHKLVSRVDLLALRDLLAEETRAYGSSTCRYACEIIDRWLTDTQHEAGNSDFDVVEPEEAFRDYIAANRLNRTHEAERDE